MGLTTEPHLNIRVSNIPGLVYTSIDGIAMEYKMVSFTSVTFLSFALTEPLDPTLSNFLLVSR